MAIIAEHVPRPACPECGAEPAAVQIERGYSVRVPHQGTAVGTHVEISWATRMPDAEVRAAPDFDVITLEPCGHVLIHGAMVEYRAALLDAVGPA